MKSNRKIKSFEAEPEVAAMLDNSKQAGLKLGDVCNAALREFGPLVIQQMAKRQRAALSKLSFAAPDFQPSGFNLIAA